jgi:hypothetical protein
MLRPIETAKPAPIDAISAQRSAYSINVLSDFSLEEPVDKHCSASRAIVGRTGAARVLKPWPTAALR